MTGSQNSSSSSASRRGLSRRSMIRALLGSAALSALAPAAFAQDVDPIQQMLNSNTAASSDGFDSAANGAPAVRTLAPTLSPDTANAVQAAVQQYSDIVSRGGWPVVNADKPLRLGVRDDAVIALRQRLAASGDLTSDAGQSNVFDSYVDAGLRHFQARHGLPTDGVLGGSTLKILNVSANDRLAQLQTNLVRLRSMAGFLGDRYIMANIPAASVEVVQNGQIVSRHTAVVGRIERETPVLNSKVFQIRFNPTWTVPASIIRKDLIPLMQKQPSYLADKHIRIFDGKMNEVPPTAIDWTTDQATKGYMFRQDPGSFNSLGLVKINFYNQYDVYMHDTPEKSAFNDEQRFDSSGCVRVQNIRQVIGWLLQGDPTYTPQRIDEIFRTGESIDVPLKPEVPVYFEYVTAWASPDGVVSFRDDIYNRDGIGQLALQ